MALPPKRKKLFRKLQSKFRLVVLNDQTFEERFSLKLTPMNVLVFGGTFVPAPGIAEIISPLLISNKTANTIYVDIQVYRYNDYSTVPETPINDVFSIGTGIPIAAFDTLPFPFPSHNCLPLFEITEAFALINELYLVLKLAGKET